jgi:hypothetical protein
MGKGLRADTSFDENLATIGIKHRSEAARMHCREVNAMQTIRANAGTEKAHRRRTLSE